MKVNITFDGHNPNNTCVETLDGQKIGCKKAEIIITPEASIAVLDLAIFSTKIGNIESVISLDQLKLAAAEYGMKLVKDSH